MAITPYGAVLEQNSPSPMEALDYFQKQKAERDAIAVRNRLADIQERKLASERHAAITKPLLDYKVNTGMTGTDLIHPDEVIGKMVTDKLAGLQKMYDSGASDADANQYISSSIRDLDLAQNQYKNGSEDLKNQLATVKEGDGVDVNDLRQLGNVELLDPANKGKATDNLLVKIIQKHPDALHVNNADKLYNFPMDNPVNADVVKVKNTLDGRVGRGHISTHYNTLYQDLKQNPDYSYEVVTRADTANLNGQPVKVLPEDAYQDFRSNIGRMVRLEQGVKKELASEKEQNEYDANIQAGQMLGQQYGMKLSQMSAAKRMQLRKDLKSQILASMPVPDEEIVRRKVAYDQADKLIPKQIVNPTTERDVSPRTTVNINKNGDVEWIDYADKIRKAAGTDGVVPNTAIDGKIKTHIVEQYNKAHPKFSGLPGVSEDDIQLKVENGVINKYLLVKGKPQLIGVVDEDVLNTDLNPAAKQDQQALKKAQGKGAGKVTPAKGGTPQYRGLDKDGNPIFN